MSCEVTCFRLDDWCSIPSRNRGSSLYYYRQTSSGAHSISYAMSVEGSFLRGKAAGA